MAERRARPRPRPDPQTIQWCLHCRSGDPTDGGVAVTADESKSQTKNRETAFGKCTSYCTANRHCGNGLKYSLQSGVKDCRGLNTRVTAVDEERTVGNRPPGGGAAGISTVVEKAILAKRANIAVYVTCAPGPPVCACHLEGPPERATLSGAVLISSY